MNEDIVLSSGNYKVTKIVKKTKAMLFKDWEVGQVFQITMVFKSPGRNRGLYATMVKVVDKTAGVEMSDSITCLNNRLASFEYEPIMLLEMNYETEDF